MKITRVEASLHTIPIDVALLKNPIPQSFVFTSVETDTGLVGYGLTGWIQCYAVREFINREIAPQLLGADPLSTERVWHDLFHTLNPRSQTGVWSSAVSAIDIALWDIKGKHARIPVWQLLGGYSREVQTYGTFGLWQYDRDQLVESARSYVKEGFKFVKMVVAAGGVGVPKDVNEDIERVRLVREAVGEDVGVQVDANYMYSYGEAIEFARRAEQFNLTWLEEPVPGNDARLLARLRQKTRIPLAAGQNEGHKWRHRLFLEHEALDIIQPNVVWGGGYTEAIKVAAMAQSYNLPIATGGGWPHHNAHLIAATAYGLRVEYHILLRAIGELIYDAPLSPVNGVLTLTDEPGLGLTPKPEVLREFSVK